MILRPRTARSMALAAPMSFVVLWSTGFIGAKLGLPHAEPLTFLAVRFLLTAAIMTLIALVAGARWPRDPRTIAHLAVAGCLLNTLYLGCVYVAISRGVGAGTSALIVSLQPLLIASVAGPLLGERVSVRQWAGLALGLAGCGFVVWPKLGTGEGDMLGLLLCIVGLLGIAAGTLYQKRFCQGMRSAQRQRRAVLGLGDHDECRSLGVGKPVDRMGARVRRRLAVADLRASRWAPSLFSIC